MPSKGNERSCSSFISHSCNLPQVAIAQILSGSFSTSRMISKASCIAGSGTRLAITDEAEGVQNEINGNVNRINGIDYGGCVARSSKYSRSPTARMRTFRGRVMVEKTAPLVAMVTSYQDTGEHNGSVCEAVGEPSKRTTSRSRRFQVSLRSLSM